MEIWGFDLKRQTKTAHLHRITRHRRIIAEKILSRYKNADLRQSPRLKREESANNSVVQTNGAHQISMACGRLTICTEPAIKRTGIQARRLINLTT